MSAQYHRRLHIESPAKINLFLEVLGKRPDGYHELETIMTRVSLCDSLSFENSSGDINVSTTFVDSNDSRLIADPNENLVYKTLARLRQCAGIQRGMQVKLNKRIPIQAGLGGASSNSAATLLAANELWDLNWPVEQLNSVAMELGSDISFFLFHGMKLCRGRGERIEPITAHFGTAIVIVMPPDGIETRLAFGKLVLPKKCKKPDSILAALDSGDMNSVAVQLHNRFSDAVNELSPWPKIIAAELKQTGALGGQVTGSGSSWFGIYKNFENAIQATQTIQNRQPELRTFCCRTIPW